MSTSSIEDDIFCLQYRFNLLSNLLIEHKTERWVEGCVYPATHREHVQRYEFASRFAAGKTVLDLACGVGQGSAMLASAGALSVLAGDLEPDAIRYARIRHTMPNITYQIINALEFAESDRFDLAVSFETIEHVSDPARLLQNIATSLKKDGVFIVSTPISDKALDRHPSNPYHIQEWGFQAFQELVSTYFHIECIYVQYLIQAAPVSILGRVQRRLGRTLGMVGTLPPETMKNPRLERWEEAGLKVEDCGQRWLGMQVLQCTLRGGEGVHG